ncbi:MAG TPA: hypothetical protein VFH91_08795, partial [Pyrinomonadaceae bacterium]|nr:hypothetical protein [Pyrinomonadaceae bacterium]
MRPLKTVLSFCLLLTATTQPVVAQTTSLAEQVKRLQDDPSVKAANDYIDKHRDPILSEWIAITEINAPSKQEQERAK